MDFLDLFSDVQDKFGKDFAKKIYKDLHHLFDIKQLKYVEQELEQKMRTHTVVFAGTV